MLLDALVQTSKQVAATSGRLAKTKILADLLRQAQADEIESAIAYLSGTTRQAKVGVGWATLRAAQAQSAKAPRLEIRDVDATLE
ncbi:MAG TPA: hypothetical protein VMR92_13790, partial [Gemmatimonadales bacterium]|nr:hypothetical protein [Gemmatimonadales bacterium]